MNLQQREAWSRAAEGHTLLLLDQSGTGKKFHCKSICESLTEKGIYICAADLFTMLAELNDHRMSETTLCK